MFLTTPRKHSIPPLADRATASQMGLRPRSGTPGTTSKPCNKSHDNGEESAFGTPLGTYGPQ